MRSKFEPKHLQRAKETLHRQLEVVRNEVVKPLHVPKEKPVQETPSLWKRVSGFFGRLF